MLFSVFCASKIILSDVYGCFCLRNTIRIVLTKVSTASAHLFKHKNSFH